MKKIYITTLLSIVMTLALQAQSFTSYDAFTLTNTELNGTARFVGVGGAMSALGGDATTMFYNPAGIGIYNSSEVTASLNVHWNNATLGNYGKNTFTTANFENAAYVGHWDIAAAKGKTSGFMGISFGASFNRMKNIDRNMRYSHTKNYSKSQFLAKDSWGLDNTKLNEDNFNNETVGYRAILGYYTYLTDIDETKSTIENPFVYKSFYNAIGGGDVNDDVYIAERGYNDEFALSVAGNVSDFFYFGMSFICDIMSYNRSEDYAEVYKDNSRMSTKSTFVASGTGFTYKIGVIFRPTNWLRIGGAYHTPSYYRLNGRSYGSAQANLTLPGGEKQNNGIDTPTTFENGYINGPMKAIGSLGFLLGKYGFIGVEYQWNNVSAMKIKNSAGRPNDIMNNETRTYFCDTHTARIGLEVKPIDELSIRLGGGYTTAPTKSNATRLYYRNDTRLDTHFINEGSSYNVTAGLGYRIGRHSIDFAYIWQVNTGTYYEFYNGDTDESHGPNFIVEPMNLRNVRNQIYLTYAIRF